MIQVDPLRRGRDAYASRAWADAYEALASADRTEPLEADDLERLAICALLTGRDADHLAALERAHHLHAQRHDPARAARCAFWLGLRLMLRGETGPAGGWLARAQRLVEAAADEC
ncbi:MAG TPA: hypothetical protein VM491_16255, partial [Burkholderiaceae bacterium]|nr:hypothetical protein [Burkholderiaceae bacterium]